MSIKLLSPMFNYLLRTLLGSILFVLLFLRLFSKFYFLYFSQNLVLHTRESRKSYRFKVIQLRQCSAKPVGIAKRYAAVFDAYLLNLSSIVRNVGTIMFMIFEFYCVSKEV